MQLSSDLLLLVHKKEYNRKINKHYHLCLVDKAYSSKFVKQEIIRRGYMQYIIYKRKSGRKAKPGTDDRCQ